MCYNAESRLIGAFVHPVIAAGFVDSEAVEILHVYAGAKLYAVVESDGVIATGVSLSGAKFCNLILESGLRAETRPDAAGKDHPISVYTSRYHCMASPQCSKAEGYNADYRERGVLATDEEVAARTAADKALGRDDLPFN